jgi:hypothetical protein
MLIRCTEGGAGTSLRLLWFLTSAIWIVAVIYGESLDGLLWRELAEVIPTALLPPILPPLLLAGAVRILANVCRP